MDLAVPPSSIDCWRIVRLFRARNLARKLIRQSEQQLATAGEGDGEHFRLATTIGLRVIAAGLASLVPALIPALGTRTGSNIIAQRQYLFRQRRLLEQVAQQSLRAITSVELKRLLGVVATALIAGGTYFVLGVVGGALAFAIPFAFLLLAPALGSVRVTV